MKSTPKAITAVAAALLVLVTVAATQKPPIPEATNTWEYRVLKGAIGETSTLENELNLAGRFGWVVDGMSTHSTGNSEQSVVILRRQKPVEKESD